MSVRSIGAVISVALLAACGSGKQGKVVANGEVASASTGSQPAAGTAQTAADPGPRLPANHMGRIPVLEYHVIAGTQNALYTRTVASFKADLEDVYKRGYRPITIAQMLDKNFSDVPDGMSPVVFVFDDASPSQFSYIQGADGKLTIDPNSAVGIWEDFMKTHPGWKNRGTFCMLNGAAAGHNFFGDNPKFGGQQKTWRFQKVKWLADNGFELCDHTIWHMKLNKYPDAAVQQQIAGNLMAIDSAVAGYKVRTMALPYGLWPQNKSLAWQGSWTDPKTGVAHPYHFDAVLEVAGGPTRSPYDPQFDPHHITRIQAVANDIHTTLDQLDKTKTRFVK
ncbi:MAG TPA: polysaccharide deacetylase family protein [Gemmatimonadaceae bacterium]|nr:polysaccharide deacetylase family protein [Gemmatimonadaceae bacterium]